MDSPIAGMDLEASKMGEQMMSHLLKAVTDTCPPVVLARPTLKLEKSGKKKYLIINLDIDDEAR